MNFKIKCQIQKIMSLLPNSEKVGYYFSRYITKNLTPNNDRFLLKVNEGFNHLQNFNQFNQIEKNTYNYFEFGAGWTLTIPIVISRMGYKVNCIDIRKLVVPELIYDSINKFKLNENNLPTFVNALPSHIDKNKNILTNINELFNINYQAPKDARNTGFPENHFDFISSTLTLCFIPKNDLKKILEECFKILKKGAVMSVTIDYQDNWSYVDANISGYNYLTFSEQEWKKYNPSINYQNRLRHKDYLALFQEIGFTIVKEKTRAPEARDIEKLKSLPIHPDFKNYSLEELGIKDGEIVVRK